MNNTHISHPHPTDTVGGSSMEPPQPPQPTSPQAKRLKAYDEEEEENVNELGEQQRGEDGEKGANDEGSRGKVPEQDKNNNQAASTRAPMEMEPCPSIQGALRLPTRTARGRLPTDVLGARDSVNMGCTVEPISIPDAVVMGTTDPVAAMTRKRDIKALSSTIPPRNVWMP